MIPGYTIVAFRVPRKGEWYLGPAGPTECDAPMGISCYYLILTPLLLPEEK